MGQGAAVIASLQAALACSGKCDCCENLQNQINEINNKLNNFIPQSEKSGIIDAGAFKAQDLILPAVGIAITNAINPLSSQIGIIREIADDAINIGRTATTTAANAASAAASALSKIAGIALSIASILASIAALEVLGFRIDNIESGLNLLGNDVSRVFGLLPSIKNLANQANDLANQAIRDLNDLKSLFNSAISALTRYVDSKIEGLNNYISLVNQKVDSFASQFVSSLASIISRITKIENDIIVLGKSLDTALNNSQSAIILAKDALGQIADIRSIINRIPGIESAIAILQGRISNLEQKISGLLASLDSLIQAKVTPIVQSQVPGIIQSLVPGIIQSQVPGIIQSQVPGIIQSQVPGIIQSQVPGIIQILVPAIVISFIPSIVGSVTSIVTNTITNIINSMNVDLTPVLNAVSNVDAKVTSIQAFTGVISQTTQEIKGDVKTVNGKMGGALKGGLSGWMLRFTSWSLIDRIIAILTLATSVHNAVQLSSSIGDTLIQVMQTTIDLFGIKDSEGQSFNLQQIIGKNIDSLATSILGAKNLADLKLQWAKWNRIYQSAANLSSNIRQLFDSSLQLSETIAENTGKIGNSLRDNGVVAADAYNQMSEKYEAARDKRFGKMLNGLEKIDSAASSMSSITSDIKDIKDELGEVKESRDEFKKSLENLKPDPKSVVNKPVLEREKADDKSTEPPKIIEGDENGR
jgi:predicted  nucleic acid-binding Zn-ribbon protein